MGNNSTQRKQDTFEKIVNKAANVIFKNTTTGAAGRAGHKIQQRENVIDQLNRELENTSPQDTDHTKKIFED